MDRKMARTALALCAPFLLLGCVLSPGKFVSSLTINADRSFSFTYKGEVIALDMDEFGKSMGADSDSNAEPVSEADGPSDNTDPADASLKPAMFQHSEPVQKGLANETEAAKKAEKERKYQALADALRKEEGYRSVEYAGNGKFIIDYAISGRLTHGFVFPYNVDAEAVFPFVMIELRKNGVVRVKAPAFGKENSNSGSMDAIPGAKTSSDAMDGVFTLDTDAEIISQNNEDGAVSAKDRRTISWKVTPLSKTPPMAVLKLKP